MAVLHVDFAGVTVAITHEGPQVARILEFLFGLIPLREPGPSSATYRLIEREASGDLLLYRGEVLIYKGPSPAYCANLLLGNVCHTLAAESREGLVFHAAALSRGDGCIVLPGTMGAGKTTLAAWLVGQGLTYLTDELVFVPGGEDEIQGFARPFNLKTPAVDVLAPWFDLERPGCEIWTGPNFALLPPRCLGSFDGAARPHLRVIVFPQYVEGADLTLRALTGAQTGLDLMSALVNARNLPDHGFPEIARLARMPEAYRVRYGDFSQLKDRIPEILESL